MVQRESKKQKLNKNAGFSLVEVLVCIAIVALISVPIMAGFRTSALYTNKAHKTQKVTAYAQETLETAKSVDVEEFKSMIDNAVDADGNDAGSVSEDVDTTLKSQFPSEYSDDLFRRIMCRQQNIEIDGELYDMEVTFSPTQYSQKKAAGDDAFSLTTADDANVYAINEVDAVDGMLFPVIADEIGQFEGNQVVCSNGHAKAHGAVLYNLQGLLKSEQMTGSEGDRIAAIYSNLTKTVKVTIDQIGSETGATLGGVNYIKNQIKVSCDVIYESSYNGVALKQAYNVFSGNYELLGRLAADGSVEEWEQGGNIYIFATAYCDANPELGMPAANKIEIVNNYGGSGKLDIYLVRGYYYEKDGSGNFVYQKGLQFDSVTLNGTTYATVPSGSVLSGELSTGNSYLHTNIKGMLTSRELQISDFEQTVGMKKPTMRCYHVNIRMVEQSSGDEVVNIETTKEIR